MAQHRHDVDEIPKLVPLRYGNPYCTGCGDTLHEGWLVAWWRERRRDGAWGAVVYCAACHNDRVRVRKLQHRQVDPEHEGLNREWRGRTR